MHWLILDPFFLWRVPSAQTARSKIVMICWTYAEQMVEEIICPFYCYITHFHHLRAHKNTGCIKPVFRSFAVLFMETAWHVERYKGPACADNVA